MTKKEKTPPLGDDFRKFQPKLRMIANCNSDVNAIRAEMCASISVEDDGDDDAPPIQRGAMGVPRKWSEIPKTQTRGSQKSVPDDVVVNVFIETNDSIETHAAAARSGAGSNTRGRRSNLLTARVSLDELKTIGMRQNVTRIELGEPLAAPMPEVSKRKPEAPRPRRFGSARQHQHGEGVLIGIIDVGGFDFTHPDFLDERGRTRFERIWDQGAPKGFSRPSPQPLGQFDYGAEFKKEHLDKARSASARLGVPAYELERQTQMSVGSHATHVASIAAGNRGLCPRASLAGVLVSLPAKDNERRQSFYDSTRVADAVDYLIRTAHDLKLGCLSINVSLGTNGHAHDGSSAISRWIDAAMSTPGRCITVAAGNAGQEVAAFEGDRGYVMGRIHTSGVVPGRGLVKDIEWLVVGNGEMDLSENELEIWYSSQDRFAVEVRPPGADKFIGPIEPRQYIENQQLSDGSFLSIYNELYHPANGSNYISIYLSPFFTPKGVVGIRAGRWTVRLHGREVRDGSYHGWIERDDPRPLGRIGERAAWRFPSCFSEESNVDDSQVSSLACGRRVISVANLDEAKERVNRTSSQGPTRDSRFKPDIAAPGTDVVAAKGFAGPKDLWVSMSGTSMASPFVAGVAGLMLAANPKLTAAQIEGIIVRNARPLPGNSFKWANSAGFGRLDPEACLKEAVAMKTEKEDRTKKGTLKTGGGGQTK